MNPLRHTFFVPNDTAGSRKETAVLLVGTAKEYGISQQDIASTRLGFYITDELADLVFEDVDEDLVEEPGEDLVEEFDEDLVEEFDEDLVEEPEEKPKPKGKSSKKTSGNRAAKNASQEGE